MGAAFPPHFARATDFAPHLRRIFAAFTPHFVCAAALTLARAWTWAWLARGPGLALSGLAGLTAGLGAAPGPDWSMDVGRDTEGL